MLFFFFKQKTAYEMRISDWSSDVCSSDLALRRMGADPGLRPARQFPVIGEFAHLLHPGIGGIAHQRVHTVHPVDERLPLVLPRHSVMEAGGEEIGRASCRERVCQYV